MNITNARRAAIIIFVNSALALAMSFGLPLSDIQESAIITFANAALGLWVALTYKDSPMRIPDNARVFPSVEAVLDDQDLREPMA